MHALKERFRPSAAIKNGTNDFGKPGYYFRMYALNVENLALKADAKRVDLDRVLKGHVLGEAQYMGRYERK